MHVNPMSGTAIALATVFALTFDSPAKAQPILAEGHMPAVGDYIAYCDGNYNGLQYCDFADTFILAADAVATAIVRVDPGCAIMDQQTLSLYYEIATADTYEVVATSGTLQVTCTPGDPPGDGSNNGNNEPVVLSIPATQLVAGRPYFTLMRAVGDPRARAKWGVDAGHQTSFQVLGQGGPLTIIGIAWGGAWAISETYAAGDGVSFGGSSYISLQDENTGQQPDFSPAYWDPIAQKGEMGANGSDGAPGPQGIQGPEGSVGPQGPPGADGVSGSVIGGNYSNTGNSRFLVPWANATTGTEDNANIPVPSGVASKLVVSLTTAPGAGGSATITVRKNASDTPLSCTVSDLETGCTNSSDSVVFGDGDLLSVSYAEADAAGSRIRFGFEYNAP